MASFISTKTYKPGRSEESSFSTVLYTEPLVVSIFRRGIIARHAPPDAEKGVWLTIFALAKRKFISCPGYLIRKLGIYAFTTNYHFFLFHWF